MSVTPAHLWFQAVDEHPVDVEARRRRYRELMAEHGLLTPGIVSSMNRHWLERV